MDKREETVLNKLLFSCEYGLLDDVKGIHKCYDIGVVHNDEFIANMVYRACKSGNLELVKYLVDLYKFDIVNYDESYNNICLETTCNCNLDLIKYLIEEHGANANVYCYPFYLITYFVENGDLDAVKYLIEHGAKINFDNREAGWSLRFAIINGRLDILKYLLDHGTIMVNNLAYKQLVNVNHISYILLKQALMVNNFDIIEYLKDNYDVSIKCLYVYDDMVKEEMSGKNE